MNKYKVYVSRMYFHTATLEVVAATSEEAEEKARGMLPDTDLQLDESVPDSDYAEVISEEVIE